MLPPGHIAGGYLAARVAGAICPTLNTPEFFILTSFFGFFPDLDFFLAFLKIGKMRISERVNHRTFATHAPLLYLLVFAIAYFSFPNYHYIAWAFIIGTWSHFIIDTFAAEGIPWLYPFKKGLIGFSMDHKVTVEDGGFVRHWWNFVKGYSKVFSFKAEIILIVIALIVLIKF